MTEFDTVRVCIESGLVVRLIPGDRCLAHGASPQPCRTALAELPPLQAAELMRRSKCYEHIPGLK